jgi:hypothetical protein
MSLKTQAKLFEKVTGPGGTKDKVTLNVVPGFAVFIDTHRDQPHVPTFEGDIHRGWCKPTLVDYAPPPDGSPVDNLGHIVRSDGRVIEVDPKHRFVDLDWWTDYVTSYVIENGRSPVMGPGEFEGQLPTAHLRDSHKKVYHLKSLRQIVKGHPSATTTGVAYKPTRTRKAGSK